MDLELKGRRALVTGGSRGIGSAIAQALAAEGCAVALCARGPAGVDAAVAAIERAGGQAYGEAFDVRDARALAGFMERSAARWGGLDIVVSNVSTRSGGPDADLWRDAFDADLLQHVRLAELALPHLLRGNDASLLFVASIAAVMTQALPDEVAYGPMKAGLVNYAGALAERYGPKGVRVNCVSPGPIDFEGGAWDLYRRNKPRLYEMATRMSALGRLGRPVDVARAVAFLCSPAAGYITAANLRIDGGSVKSTNF